MTAPWRTIMLAPMALGAAAAFTPAMAQQAAIDSEYSDAELSAFAAARADIEPIQLAMIVATPEESARDDAQINAILRSHNLSRDDYDAIATIAKADDAFATRIANLEPAGASAGGA